MLVDAQPSRESFRELRKLMRQQKEEEQNELQVQQFRQDIDLWTQSLSEMGLSFAAVIEQCRPLGSGCAQRYVQRHLRSLRRSCNELRAQLESLEIKYFSKVSEQQLLMPTLGALRAVLREYDGQLRLVYAEAYKLVEQ